MTDITIGKFTLESLSTGMYSDPKAIYREYIPNATDAIDRAVHDGIMDKTEAEIHIIISVKKNSIVIRDNGTGIPAASVRKTLSDIGNSTKDYARDRGFRGIGRLAGLAYAKTLYFTTSSVGERIRTTMMWDCQRMRELLSPSNTELNDIVSVINAISSVTQSDDESADSHYFEVRLEEVSAGASELVDEDVIKRYLSSVAPVNFDGQKFRQGAEIEAFFASKSQVLPNYRILFGEHTLSIYKPYSQSMGASTGRSKQRQSDFVREIEFLYEEDSSARPLYIGWLAITDFSGQISDPYVRGIRLRKNNMQIGSDTTFDSFFPSEGNAANKMFAGEIHILSPDILPNSQRDDFEPNEAYAELREKLSAWAGEINRCYRRGTSVVSSAIRKINECDQKQEVLSTRIKSGVISSDTKRQECIDELSRIERTRQKASDDLKKAMERTALEPERSATAQKALTKADQLKHAAVNLTNQIVQADYATKGDLPSNYSREERKLYQRIIEVIDRFFVDQPQIADDLRKEIIQELSVKKK